MATLPFAAHGDTLAVSKISPKYEGSGEARHIIGAQVTALLLFDNCAQVPHHHPWPGYLQAAQPGSCDGAEHEAGLPESPLLRSCHHF